MSPRKPTPPRGDGPKPLLEADVLRACRDLLDALKMQGRLTYRRIHVMPIQVGNKGQRRINRDMAGMADLLIFLKNKHSTTLHVELKSHAGSLSESQNEWMRELKGIGHYYYVCKSVGELEAVLAQHGVEHFSFRGRAKVEKDREMSR